MATQNYTDWSKTYTDWSQNYTDWSQTSGPCAEVQKMNQEASEKMIRECISFNSDNTGSLIKYLQTMPRTTNPEDSMTTGMKLMSQQGEKVLEFTKNVFDIYQETMKEQLQWAQSNPCGTSGKKSNKTRKDSE